MYMLGVICTSLLYLHVSLHLSYLPLLSAIWYPSPPKPQNVANFSFFRCTYLVIFTCLWYHAALPPWHDSAMCSISELHTWIPGPVMSSRTAIAQSFTLSVPLNTSKQGYMENLWFEARICIDYIMVVNTSTNFGVLDVLLPIAIINPMNKRLSWAFVYYHKIVSSCVNNMLVCHARW